MPPERRSPPYSGNSQAQLSERLSFEMRGECAEILQAQKKGPVVKLSLHVLYSQLCHVFTELLHHFSSFRAAKIGPVKQAITSIERSYLFLVGGILLSQAHVIDIRLQAVYLAGCNSDSLSETEIIPFSGVSKSGAGIISGAGGAGGFGH
ncbi:Uncharacterised protein [Yersinia enterocolitica]|nr:Uncharacterised protein [Yersinia enterocolitica]